MRRRERTGRDRRGELRRGAARGLDSCVYYTSGTGVGMGAVIGGRRVYSLVHPESGGKVLCGSKPEPECN